MPYLILGASLLLGFGLIGYWFLNADPAKVRSTGKWILVGLAALLIVGLLAFRRFDWLIYAGAALIPIGLRAHRIFTQVNRKVKMATGPVPGQTSSVKTETLAMTLDHDSGSIDGEVLRGRFAGAMLSALSLEQVLELLHDCARCDKQSVPLLESYLDTTYGEDWRARAEAGSEHPETTSAGMTRSRALEILGLDEGADEAAIREAHRRLMMINHPDRGGSDFLAAQINEAKDVLLKT